MVTRIKTAVVWVSVVAMALAFGCAQPPEAPVVESAMTEVAGPTADWPQWRGPERNGVATSLEGLAEGFGAEYPAEVWRRPIGDGFAGIAVAGGVVYTLAADVDSETESLLALAARTGEEQWAVSLGPTLMESHGNGPRSAPAVMDDTVYALGSQGRLLAVALDGSERWRFDFAPPPTWGYAASPLIEGDVVIVHGRLADGAAGVVHGFDRTTGALEWSAGEGGVGYGSPLGVEIDGVRQVASFVGSGLIGVDPTTGDVLWRHPWDTSYDVNAAEPVVIAPDRLYLSSGYGVGAAVIEVSRDGEAWRVEEIWRGRQMKNHFSSSVLVDGVIYGFDNSVIKAIRAEDGLELWKARGFGKGSIVVSGEHLLVLGERGELGLVEANPEAFVELGRVRVLEGRSWTPPSVAGRWFFARNHDEIVALILVGDD